MKPNTVTFSRIWDGTCSEWKPEKRKDGFFPMKRELVLTPAFGVHQIPYALFELFECYQDDRDGREVGYLPHWQRKCRQEIWSRCFYGADFPSLTYIIEVLASSQVRGKHSEGLAHQLYWELVRSDEGFRKLMPRIP